MTKWVGEYWALYTEVIQSSGCRRVPGMGPLAEKYGTSWDVFPSNDKQVTNNADHFSLLITADNLFAQRQLSLFNVKFEIDYGDLQSIFSNI